MPHLQRDGQPGFLRHVGQPPLASFLYSIAPGDLGANEKIVSLYAGLSSSLTFLLIFVLNSTSPNTVANLPVRVPRNIRPLVEQRDHHAQHPQLRIGPRPNPLVRLQQIVRAFNRKIRRLNRHQQMCRRTPARSPSKFPAMAACRSPYNRNLSAPARARPSIGTAHRTARLNTVSSFASASRPGPTHSMRILARLDDVRHRRRAYRSVHRTSTLFAAYRKMRSSSSPADPDRSAASASLVAIRRRQIYCRGRLPDSTLLVRNRDDRSHLLLPPPKRKIIRADVTPQPGPDMWVLLAESPLGLGPLYVRNPFQRKGKVEIHRDVGGKLRSSVLGHRLGQSKASSVQHCILKRISFHKIAGKRRRTHFRAT